MIDVSVTTMLWIKKDGRDWNIIIIQWMRWKTWMDEMFHVFSPSHMFSHINHNHISYLSQIYSLGFTIRVWGFLPPSTIPYGIVDGADTIHPAFIHGSTCLRNSNWQSCWCFCNTIYDWLCTTFQTLCGHIIGYQIDNWWELLLENKISFTLEV